MTIEKRGGDLLRGKGGLTYWTNEIEKASLKTQLLPFNDVLSGYEPGVGEPMVRDAIVDGVKVDIYHSDKDNTSGIKSGRIYIHLKERAQVMPNVTPFFGPKEREDDIHLEANERP